MKILIDNGHGVETPGKRSPDGKLREYAWNREMAIMLEAQLRQRGYDAERIVTEERDVSLSERVRRVNRWCDKLGAKNCVLISVHINAGPEGVPGILVEKDVAGTWKTCRGFSSWVAPNASEASRRLARIFYNEAVKRGLKGNRAKPADGYWVGNFTIIAKTKCPAVLTENLFQDNRADVAYLKSPEGKANICALHIQAIEEYLR